MRGTRSHRNLILSRGLPVTSPLWPLETSLSSGPGQPIVKGMSLLLALLFFLQEDQTVFRTEKTPYMTATAQCKEAQQVLQSSPQEAIDILTGIIDTPKIRKIECRIRIQVRSAEYTSWYMFLPYQYRGQARMNLASSSSPEAAEKLLMGAAQDFQTSVDKGVAASGSLLKKAKAELEKVRASLMKPDPGPDPVIDHLARVRPAFRELLGRYRFKSALDFLEQDGKELTPEQKKTLQEEARSACNAYLDTEMIRFRGRLGGIRDVDDLKQLSTREFDVLFTLPESGEIITPHPVFAWAENGVAAFRKLRSGNAGAEALLPVAASAAPLIPDGQNRWFSLVEELAHGALRESVRSRVLQAASLDKAGRDAKRGEVDGLMKAWKDFIASLDPKFVKQNPDIGRHDAGMDALLVDWPAELPGVAEIDPVSCFADADPEKAFEKMEADLRKLDGGTKVATVESRRTLYTKLAAAIALRVLIGGGSESDAVSAIGPIGSKLAGVGGAETPDAFGPRVARVLGKLR